MTALIYTCDACGAARGDLRWLDPHELRGLVRVAHLDPHAVEISRICSHAVSVQSGSLLWLGPWERWLDGVTRFAPRARPAPTTPTEAYADPGWEDATALRQLAAMAEDKLTIELLGGELAGRNLLVVTGEWVRWVGERARWGKARLPYLIAALARAS